MTHEQPSPRPSASSHDDLDVDKEVQHLRAQLQQSRDVSTLTALSHALRRRFFSGPGDPDDLKESLGLLHDTPRPTIESIGTAELSLHRKILPGEENWVRWQPWIEEQGYMLPERLRPDWTPSWSQSPDPTDEFISPDGFGSKNENITDAVRISDGLRVFFKLCPENATQELEISAFFSAEPRRSDPRNHCYPLLDVLRPPLLRGQPYHILVYPLLRPLFKPDPDTVEDILTSIIALAEVRRRSSVEQPANRLQGLAFMHEHHVAHQDVHYRNAMMDATYLMPEGWHPWMRRDMVYAPGQRPRKLTVLPRSQVAMRYFLTDFGMSVKYPSLEGRGLVTGLGGLNRTLPEQSDTVPYDPFPADVRMFGDMLHDWQYGFLGLDFLDPLVSALRQETPSLRPTAAEMVATLRTLASECSRFSLQLPLRRRDAPGTPFKVWFQYLTRVLIRPTSS